MSDLDDLRSKASYKYDELIAVEKENGEKLDALIVLLGALCDSNDEIVNYKEEQKQGDIKFRKKTNVSSFISISIAITALTVSVVGVEYFVDLFKGLLV